MSKKIRKARLDALLVERGLAADTREAQAFILAGKVLVNEEKIDKAGTSVAESAAIRVLDPGARFVSRGGEKLEAALDFFKLDPSGKICLDVGASTGGFTDCLLRHGAERVISVDVGTNQLDWRLRSDPRVMAFENVNARALGEHLPEAALTPPPDLAVIDVSFISLRLVLPSVVSVIGPKKEILALVKPHFEAARDEVEPGGIVSSEATQLRVCADVRDFAGAIGLSSSAPFPSPVVGKRSGNQEYFLHMIASAAPQ